jgi:glyoxalase-like protein
MSSARSPASLDHIILLVPSLSNLPASITQHFTLTAGGTHADGLTENILISLASGTYIELIAFTDKAPPGSQARSGHWWGEKREGTWIDWCLGGYPPSKTPEQQRDGGGEGGQGYEGGEEAMGIEYARPMGGGRVLPGGNTIRWEVTFPSATYVRGSVPFFCHDVTPRELRVPGSKEAIEHPCGAVGVAEVRIACASGEDVRTYGGMYGGVVGGGEGSGDGAQGLVDMTHPGEDGKLEEVGLQGEEMRPRVRVVPAEDEGEKEVVRANGGKPAVVEVVFYVHGDDKSSESQRADEELARISFRRVV